MFGKKTSIKDLLPPPTRAEHQEYSMILSAKDSPAKLTPSLLKLSLEAIENASKVDLKELYPRGEQAKEYVDLWPGEHYRLLAGLTQALKPKKVIEIGTSTGLSSLCIKQYLPKDSQLITFDIRPWQSYPDTLFQIQDFADQPLSQIVADISDDQEMEKHHQKLLDATLIFIDATHDGLLEKKLLSLLRQLNFKSKPVYILLDDIRVWTMLKMFREIDLPKVDLTSFGHWSGTGLIELS